MKEDDDIDDKAFDWVMLQKEGPLSTEQQLEFDMWLSQDPRHLKALIQARALDDYFMRLGAFIRNPPRVKPVDAGRRRLLAAAVSTLAATGVGARLWSWLHVSDAAGGYVTRVGETRRIVLADASEVLLNTATEVLIHGGSAPEIQLLRGEALFTIAHAMRPLTVYVDDWVLQTVHATFSVLKGPDHVDVTVQTGGIETHRDDASAQSQQLYGDEEGILPPGGVAQMHPLSPAMIEQRLAWRKGLVIFDNEPTRQAVAQMNRYTARKIVLDDLPVFGRTLTGVFRCTDTEAFVQTLELELGVHALERGNSIFLTSSRKQ